MGSVVPMLKRDYFSKWEHEETTKRPFRIYAAKCPAVPGRKQPQTGDLPGRRYKTSLRAHDQTLLLVRWEPEGTVYEVYDVRNGSLIGTYERVPKAVNFRVLKGGK